MNLSKTASAIGLYAHHPEHPGPSLYARFYAIVREQIATLGVEPTYFSAVGEGCPERFVKYGGRVHKRVVDANFENVTGISLAATRPGSDAPAYDSFFDSAVGFVKSKFKGSRTYLYFVINESFLPFGSEAFERVFFELLDLHPWDYGMGYCETVERRPVFHFAEVGHDKLMAEERGDFQAWYCTPAEVRMIKLRSIYPYNVVNERQLAQKTQTGASLKEFIENGSVGTLRRLPGDRLWLWNVPEHEQRVALRRQLHWNVPDWRQLRKGQVDLNQPGIVIDSATLIP